MFMDLKRGFLFGIGAMIALSLVFVYAGNALASESTATPVVVVDKDKTITVTGTGYVYAEPDMAKITIGVTTESDTSTGAMSKNADLMSAVMSAVKSVGIPAKDIQTTRVAVDPVYSYSTAKPKITGYRATNTVTVTVRDTSKVGPVIDAAYKAGANDINGVNFMLSEERSADVYKQALDKAIAQGSDKAKTIANAAGVANPQLKSVSESASYSPPVPLYEARAADTAGAATPISTGEERVQATVTMVYTFA
jgi:uncharacterized protein YggE